MTFGGRYTSDNREASRTTQNSVVSPAFTGITAVEPTPGNPAAIDEDFSKFNPAFTANMAWTDDLSTYLRIATGYKAGGIAESGAPGTFGPDFVFQPEEILTYELGLKSMLADNRVRLNMAVFYSEFDDMQLGFNTNPADLSEVLLQNAGEATIGGVELEGTWAATDMLTFSVNASYLDPEIDEVKALPGTIFDPASNSSSPYQVGDNIAELFALPYTSETSYTVSADWTFLQFDVHALSAHLNYRWQDDFFASAPTGPGVPNRDFYAIPSHDTLDARLMWTFDMSEGRQARVAVWGNNILDEEAPQHIIAQGAIIDLEANPLTGAPETPAGLHALDLFLARGSDLRRRPDLGVLASGGTETCVTGMASGIPPMLTAQRDSALKKVSAIAMCAICSALKRSRSAAASPGSRRARVPEIDIGKRDGEALLIGEQRVAAAADALRLRLGKPVRPRDVIAHVAADHAVDGVGIAQAQSLGERRADARVMPDAVLQFEHRIERFLHQPEAAVANHVPGVGAGRPDARLRGHGFSAPGIDRA